MTITLFFYRKCVYAAGSELELARLKLPGVARIERATYVEPHRKMLTFVFRVLRKAFGDHGKVANFTRRWPCRWQVDAKPIGGPLYGPFPSRKEAIAFEQEQVMQHLLSAIRREARFKSFSKEAASVSFISEEV